jgi:hypothetical protein
MSLLSPGRAIVSVYQMYGKIVKRITYKKE